MSDAVTEAAAWRKAMTVFPTIEFYLIRRSTATACLATLIATSPVGAETSLPLVQPSPEPWLVEGSFDGKKEAENISGLACAVSAPSGRACLLVSDEKLYARLVRIEGRTIRLGAKVPLLPEAEGEAAFKETDAEGVDYDGGYYYVVGSHGASKKSGAYQASRFQSYRFPVDPTSGKPTFNSSGDAPSQQVERKGTLEGIIAQIPALAHYACTKDRTCVSLQHHGVNIEGLAVRDGQMYFGLRSPVLDGEAFIVGVAADAVFGSAEPQPRLFRLKLGPSVGIRDLVKISGGYLILTGPALPEEDDVIGTAALYFWDGTSNDAHPVAKLGEMVAGAKPEAVLALGKVDGRQRILVLSDGARGGRPTEYDLPKQP